MLRCLLLCVFLLGLVETLATAEVYKCKDAQGATVYTDDPTKLPQGCDPEQTIKLSQPNVMLPQTNPSAEPETTAPTPAQEEVTPQQIDDEALSAALKGQAVALVKKFTLARKGVFRSTLVSEKKKARSEVNQARSEKKALLSEVEKSSLTRSEKRAINEILSAITE